MLNKQLNHKTMKKLLVVLLCLSSTILFAQTSLHYSVVTTGTEGTFTKVTGVLKIDGVEVYNGEGMQDAGGGDLEIGVFDQDGICRGAKKPTWRSKSNQWVYQLMMRGYNGCEYPTFKIYNHADETEWELVLDIDETIVWTNGGNYGSLNNLYSINFTSPAGSGYELTVEGYGEDNASTNKGYYLIASPVAEPVTPAAANGFIPATVANYDLYYFSQTGDTEGNEWINFKDETLGSFDIVNGKGYLYASKEGTTLVFTGAPGTDGTVTLDDYDANARFKGWNLIGNPFAEDAYINKPFYTLENSDTYTTNEAGTAIHAMQGVLIIADAEETTVTFSTEAPAANNGKLNMNLRRANKQLDNAILVFGGDQQLGKMTFRANSSKIFMPVEGKDYAITSVEGQVGEVPVSFVPESNGTYSLSFTSEEVSFSYLHLIDNMTGNDVNLLETPSYTFDARTSDYESRFRLVFATGSSTGSDTFGFVNASGNFCIFGIEGEATVQVIDVLGHVLSSEQFSGSYEKRLNVAPGVYMIRLIQGNDVKVQKVVVRR